MKRKTKHKTIKKKHKFNWLTKLNGLIRRKVKPDLKDDEQLDLEDRSGRWPTCACGQLCKGLPRFYEGEPKDQILARLGQRFDDQIRSQNYLRARKTFHLIERRTAKLLKAGLGLI